MSGNAICGTCAGTRRRTGREEGCPDARAEAVVKPDCTADDPGRIGLAPVSCYLGLRILSMGVRLAWDNAFVEPGCTGAQTQEIGHRRVIVEGRLPLAITQLPRKATQPI